VAEVAGDRWDRGADGWRDRRGVVVFGPADPAPEATLTVTYDHPDGCSSQAVVEGDLSAAPPASLWLLNELYPNPTDGLDHPLFFAKTLITPKFKVTIPVSRRPGTRNGRFLVAIATTNEANNELNANYTSDHNHDKTYSDVHRGNLPEGSQEIATARIRTQTC
jgi:hypothetical protein